MQLIILIIAALVPAVALAVFVFKKDRVEKEPIGLLLLLLFSGVVICFPAAEVESVVRMILVSIFEPFGTVVGENINLVGFPYYLYNFLWAFFGVAFVEEIFKWIALVVITRNNKNFNSLFDGIIYAVFVSLGFAGFENILYVLDNGMSNAILRAVTAVPGHMFDAVLMGMFYSLWQICKKADEYELRYQINTNSKKDFFKPKYYLALSIVVPTAAHGLYDFCCFVSSGFTTVVFLAFLIFLYIYCFSKINKFSKQDCDIRIIAIQKFRTMYPDVPLEEVGIDIDAISRPEFAEETVTDSPDTQQAKMYTMPNGDKYVGTLADGKFSGFGTYYFAVGGKYEGNFANGMFSGYGTYFGADGCKFVGYWQYNKQNGYGTFYRKDGTTLTGYWQNGVLVSQS